MIPSVVIVIPIYKEQLDHLEIKSLIQCFRVLRRYPIILVAPKGMSIHVYERILGKYRFPFDAVFFNKVFFKDLEGYNKMLLSKDFYSVFSKYSYMLLYQLDAFVFKDTLQSWVEQRFSNVGAPWLKESRGGYKFIKRTGNGGLVLRNIGHCLNVLNKEKKVFTPYFEYLLFKDSSFNIVRRYYKFILNRAKTPVLSLEKYISSFPYNEDIFWAKLAPLVDKEFSTAPPAIALKFAFDSNPEILFEWNNRELPFGCHGWSKPKQLKFWEPIIEREAARK